MNITTKEYGEGKEWSKSYERNGITEKVSVRQVENGFVVCKSKYGHDTDSSSPDKWIDEKEEYISNTNPLDEGEFNEDLEELINKFK